MRMVAVLAVLACIGAAHAQTTEPYDFKGVQLGITLGEFRGIAYPEDTTGWAFPPSDRSVDCRPAIYRAGATTTCSWGPFAGEAPLVLGRSGRATRDYAFHFAPDVAGTERLFEIAVRGRVEGAGAVLAALTEKFGSPASETTVPVRTRAGQPLEQLLSIWQNAVSRIAVESPAGDLHSMAITFQHLPLSELVESRYAAEERARNPNPM